MKHINQHTLIVGFHPSHAARILRAWHDARETKPMILAFDTELEQLLGKEGIPFYSQKRFPVGGSEERFTRIEAWVAATLASAPLNSYTYHGIPFLKAYAYGLQFYLLQIAYYGPLLSRALDAIPEVHSLLLCVEQKHARPEQIVLTRDPSGAILRAARVIAKEHDISVDHLEEGKGQSRASRASRLWFLLIRSLFGICIGVVNIGMAVLPRKEMRILASENWANVAPLLSASPESELILLDRAEVRRMDIRAVFQHRVRFMHIAAYLERNAQRRARNAAQDIITHWIEEIGTVPELTYSGIPMQPFMKEALDTIFLCGVPRITREIDATFAMVKRCRPHLVLLRASVSNQTHFQILALVARSLSIPAIELQHGLEYLGPGSMSRAHTAEYVATYGPLVARELHAIGYAPDKTLVVGSPRFDAYCVPAHAAKHPSFTVLVLVPEMVTIFFDTYEVTAYYSAAAAAVRAIPGAVAIVKMRPIPECESFHRQAISEAFKGVTHTIAQYESIAQCLSSSDAIITCYSTVVLEAFLSRVPVVLVAISSGERLSVDGHFTPYADARALRIAHSAEEVTRYLQDLTDPKMHAESTTAAQAFLQEHYAFDGKSSRRMHARMRELAGLGPVAR